MNKFRKKYGPGTVFIFASDDWKWTKKYFRAQKDVFIANGHSLKHLNPAGFDLASLAACNHSIFR